MHFELWIRLRVREELGGPRVVRHSGLREEARPPAASRVGPLDLLQSCRMFRVGLKSHGANAERILAVEGGTIIRTSFTLCNLKCIFL